METKVVETEKCVDCGVDTKIPITRNVDTRAYYVEGAGQLCKECFDKIYGPRQTNP
jgi:recombinational DNA repair protein (RecF pathway)